MGFAEEFISGVMAGHNLKRAKQQEQYEQEDRDIEKNLLQHRLREMKIQEKIRARAAARENIADVEGQPEADIPASLLESLPGVRQFSGVSQPGTELGPMSVQSSPARVAAMPIPGIEELGITGTERRPQSMEQLLAAAAAEQRMKALYTPQRVGAEQEVQLPATGEVLAKGPARTFAPRGLVKVTETNAKGVSTDRWVTEAEAAKIEATRHPIPRQGGGGTTIVMSNDSVDNIVESVRAGRFNPDTIKQLSVKARDPVIAALAKVGYDWNTAEMDMRAIRTHVATLNGAQFAEKRAMADTAMAALDTLDELNNTPDPATGKPISVGAGGGIFSAATRAFMRANGTPEQKELADQVDLALSEARKAFETISPGGNRGTDKAIEDAAKVLAGGDQKAIARAIKNVRPHIQYRVSSYSQLDPILMGGGGGGANVGTSAAPAAIPSSAIGAVGAAAGAGGVATGASAPTANEVAAALKAMGRANDPTTVERVMASKEAMKRLFPDRVK